MAPKWIKKLTTYSSKKIEACTGATTTNDSTPTPVTYTISRRDQLEESPPSSEESSPTSSTSATAAPYIDVEAALRHHGRYCRAKNAIKEFLHITGKRDKAEGKAEGKASKPMDTEHGEVTQPKTERLQSRPPSGASNEAPQLVVSPPVPGDSSAHLNRVQPVSVDTTLFDVKNTEFESETLEVPRHPGTEYHETGSSIADCSDDEVVEEPRTGHLSTIYSIADVDRDDDGQVERRNPTIPRLQGCMDLTALANPDGSEMESSKSASLNDAGDSPDNGSDDNDEGPDYRSFTYGHSAGHPPEQRTT
jgi:hypothetical protein